jgi:hypothetical protein
MVCCGVNLPRQGDACTTSMFQGLGGGGGQADCRMQRMRGSANVQQESFMVFGASFESTDSFENSDQNTGLSSHSHRQCHNWTKAAQHLRMGATLRGRDDCLSVSLANPILTKPKQDLSRWPIFNERRGACIRQAVWETKSCLRLCSSSSEAWLSVLRKRWDRCCSVCCSL